MLFPLQLTCGFMRAKRVYNDAIAAAILLRAWYRPTIARRIGDAALATRIRQARPFL
jgi:hypothetical protein